MRIAVKPYADTGMNVLSRAEAFWQRLDASTSLEYLLRYTALLSLLPLAGYLVYYTLIGKVWNYYPFIRTTLTVPHALMCAGLQWVFFTTFPTLSSLLLNLLFSKSEANNNFQQWNVITAYAMTPLFLAALFVGVPFINGIVTTLAMAMFVYMQYYGCRIYAQQGMARSVAMTFCVGAVFAFIRQMFIHVIGW